MIQDRESERTVLGGILWEAEIVFPALAEIRFKVDCFTTHWHQLVYTQSYEMWVAFEKVNLMTAFRRLKRFRAELADPLGFWIAETVNLDRAWPIDLSAVGQWWHEKHDGEPLWVMLAMAAAKKVQWLATRRHAIHRAKELLRDAENGSGDPEYFDSQL